MKTLYFDLIDGISGDMVVASLLDLDGNIGYLKAQLKKINIGGYKIKYSCKKKAHINAARFVVANLVKKRTFQLTEITKKIKSSSLNAQIKKNILDIYQALYLAEKKVHRSHRVHFHQIGEIDSLIDIASSCILIDKLKVGQILYSSIPLGDKVAPATACMLKSKNVYLSGHRFENITPTGIAIITTLGRQLQKNIQDSFTFDNFGCGIGSIKDSDSLNVLRAVLLKNNLGALSICFAQDKIAVIQCNIDDMSPQILSFLMNRLYKAGALEVFFQNYYTKKSRPGILISVLSKPETFDTIADIIFKETTTLGIRYFIIDRLKLNRRERILDTSIGKIRLKEILDERYRKIIPEYDDCAKIAGLKNIPLRDVFKQVHTITENKRAIIKG